MSEADSTLTKREFLVLTCAVLGEVLNTDKLKVCLEAAAASAGIPEPSEAAAAVLAKFARNAPKGARAPKEAAQKGKVVDSATKEKSKRDNVFSVFVSYFSDYIAHYGHSPVIQELRKEYPSLFGLTLASKYYKTLSAKQKDAFKAAVLDAVKDIPEDEKGSGHALQALKKYDADHPEKTVGSLVGLDLKAEYKTDPAQMKQEAATARRQAGNVNGATAADQTGAPTPSGKGGQDAMEVDAAAAQPAAQPATTPSKKAKTAEAVNAAGPGPSAANGKSTDGKGTKKRKHEDDEQPTSGKKAKTTEDAEAAEKDKAAAVTEEKKEKKKDKEEKKKDKEHKEEKKKDKEHKEEKKKDKEHKAEKKKDKEHREEKKKDKEGKDADKKEKKKDKEGKDTDKKKEKEGKDTDNKEKKKDKEHKEKGEQKSAKKEM